MRTSEDAKRCRATLYTAGLCLSAVLLAGCGEPTHNSNISPDIANAPLHDQLPTDIKSSGEIRYAAGSGYPPFGYMDKDGKTHIGLDVDLVEALSKQLGVRFIWIDLTGAFATAIPSLQSRKNDLVIAGMENTEDRRKVVDFVDYLQANDAIFVKGSNKNEVKDDLDICGKTIAVATGNSGPLAYLATLSKKCSGAGKPAPEVKVIDRLPAIVAGVQSGQLYGGSTGLPAALYTSEATKGAVAVVARQRDAGTIGIAVSKDRPELKEAVRKAMQNIMHSGEYQKLLEKWKLWDLRIDARQIK